jgi:transposase
VRRFDASGSAGLRDAARSGQPRALDAQSWPRIEVDLRRSPAEFGLRADRWDGPVLSEHLRHSYEVTLGIRQCQRMFRQMGFRLRTPRPQVAPSDPQAVAVARKTPPAGKPRRH